MDLPPESREYLSDPSSYRDGKVLLDDEDLRIVHALDPSVPHPSPLERDGIGYNVEVHVKKLEHRSFPLVVQYWGGSPQLLVWTTLSPAGCVNSVAARFPHEVTAMPDGSRRVRLLSWYY